jgi:DNA repair photolyase|tara:strand:- start:1428 stop:1640 length:213 start_codon:yes stop_codon:yes gene_type:complete
MVHKEIEEFAAKVAQQQDSGVYRKKQRLEIQSQQRFIEALQGRIKELEEENLELKKSKLKTVGYTYSGHE